MTGDLHSLAYFSRNAMDDDPAVLEAGLRDILETARRRNRQINVTGALLFAGGCFAQVLEGPLAAVEQLFETIQCDPRHNDVTILHFHPIAERSFPQWAMAFAGQDNETRERALAAATLGDPGAIEAAAQGQDFLSVLRDLVQRDEAFQRVG